MRKILAIPFFLALLGATSLIGQVNNPSVRYVTGAPSGACTATPPVQVVISTGVMYTCNNGTWAAIAGGGSIGTGIAGEFPYYAADGSALTPTSSITYDAVGGKLQFTAPLTTAENTSTSGTQDFTQGLLNSTFDYSPTTDVAGGPGEFSTIGAFGSVNLDGQATSVFSALGADFEVANLSNTRGLDTALGLYAQADNSGNGDVTHLFGVHSVATQTGSGHVTNDMIGSLTSTGISSGNVGFAVGLYADTYMASGGVTSAWSGYFAPDPTLSGGATIGTVRGVHIQISKPSAGITNSYAIDSTGTGASRFAGNLIAAGTTAVTGCSLTSAVGGTWAGSFHSGTTGTCTVTITPGTTAPNGFSCWSNDITTAADVVKQTAYNTTTATIAGTTVSGDVITWGCVAF